MKDLLSIQFLLSEVFVMGLFRNYVIHLWGVSQKMTDANDNGLEGGNTIDYYKTLIKKTLTYSEIHIIWIFQVI